MLSSDTSQYQPGMSKVVRAPLHSSVIGRTPRDAWALPFSDRSDYSSSFLLGESSENSVTASAVNCEPVPGSGGELLPILVGNCPYETAPIMRYYDWKEAM
jgi:hypothetical protein